MDSSPGSGRRSVSIRRASSCLFLKKAVDTVYPAPTIRYLFLILPTLLLIASIIGAYSAGKMMGLVSVLVAYISGLLIVSLTVLALVLLCGAVILGYSLDKSPYDAENEPK